MTTFKQCPNARDNLTVNMFEKCDIRDCWLNNCLKSSNNIRYHAQKGRIILFSEYKEC